MERNGKMGLARRDLLRAMAAGAGVTTTAALPAPALADSEGADDKRKARYRATDHVERFYAVNRYPKTK